MRAAFLLSTAGSAALAGEDSACAAELANAMDNVVAPSWTGAGDFNAHDCLRLLRTASCHHYIKEWMSYQTKNLRN